MDRVLLTGASGFGGSHMLRHLLLSTDYEIVCPVTFRHRGVANRIKLALDSVPGADKRVHVIMCDLTSPIDRVSDTLIGPINYVINYASESHVDRSISEPGPFIENNVSVAVNLLDWARHRRDSAFSPVEAVMQISTDEVYGPASGCVAHAEWHNQHLPSNPYAASKAAQESIAFSYWRTYGVPVIITNTMNLIGETQDPEKFVPMVLSRISAGAKVEIHASPDGKVGSRFYLHARNQADGVLYAMRHVLRTGHDRTTGEGLQFSPEFDKPFRFNIVGEREVSNLDMARMVAQAAGKELDYTLVDFHGSRPGHDLRYALNGSKMYHIGWQPPVPLERSLRQSVHWTLNHTEWLL